MAQKNNRAGANKLLKAINNFDLKAGISCNNPLTLALKTLREEFGENLKITSISSSAGNLLTQSISFAVTESKFDQILAEQSLSANINDLLAIDPLNIPSRTLHQLATTEALLLLGFELDSQSHQKSPLTIKSNTLGDSIESLTPESNTLGDSIEAQAPESNTLGDSIDTQAPKADTLDDSIEAQAPESNTLDDSIIPQINESNTLDATHQQDIIQNIDSNKHQHKGSRTEQLTKMLKKQEIIDNDSDEADKKVSIDIVEKIIEMMRALDLSQAAILDRLRTSSATNINDLTQKEGYRISGWLKASTFDSSAIVKKRNKFGGFNDQYKEIHVPSGFTHKVVEQYRKELTIRADAEYLATLALKQVTNISGDKCYVEEEIKNLTDKEAKAFRAAFSRLILTSQNNDM